MRNTLFEGATCVICAHVMFSTTSKATSIIYIWNASLATLMTSNLYINMTQLKTIISNLNRVLQGVNFTPGFGASNLQVEDIAYHILTLRATIPIKTKKRAYHKSNNSGITSKLDLGTEIEVTNQIYLILMSAFFIAAH